MEAYLTDPDGAFGRCSVLSLVSERRPFSARQSDLLAPFFVVRHLTPAEALGLSPADRAEALKATRGLLVYWDDQGPAVICAFKEAARRRGVPIIALCRADEAEHVAALMVGADGALPCPVSPLLLQARLRAYHRLVGQAPPPAGLDGDGMGDGVVPRISPAPPDPHAVCTVGALRLDHTARRFFAGGRAVELTPKEFDLMAFMMQHAGVCLARDVLLNEVWGIDYAAETNVLGTQMYALRRKLAAHGFGHVIQTVRGVGYRLADLRS